MWFEVNFLSEWRFPLIYRGRKTFWKTKILKTKAWRKWCEFPGWPSFPQTQIHWNDRWFVAVLNSSSVVWTENIWCVFRVKPPFSNSSGVVIVTTIWTCSRLLFVSLNSVADLEEMESPLILGKKEEIEEEKKAGRPIKTKPPRPPP